MANPVQAYSAQCIAWALRADQVDLAEGCEIRAAAVPAVGVFGGLCVIASVVLVDSSGKGLFVDLSAR